MVGKGSLFEPPWRQDTKKDFRTAKTQRRQEHQKYFFLLPFFWFSWRLGGLSGGHGAFAVHTINGKAWLPPR
jgi:hypothetical protein